MKNLVHFLLTLSLYAVLDLLWLNLFAKNFIQKQVGQYLAAQPDLKAGILFYLIFTAGLLWFCVLPVPTQGRAALNGAFFGLVTYATYELVNKALLDKWPLPLVMVDIAWGIFVGTIVSWASYKIRIWLF
ncbi:MAG: DUF2177 family protein [Saprospiraceae bacterium]